MSHSETNTSLHTDAIGHLQDLAGQLVEILDAENACLKSANRGGFLALQPLKASVAKDYELTMKAIRATKTDLKALDGATRAKLLAQHESLKQKADGNINMLNIARETTARLQARVLNAARAAMNELEPPAYSRAGRVEATSGKNPKAASYNDAV